MTYQRLSVRKISQTMRARRVDNFKNWRIRAKNLGLIKSKYNPFVQNGDLAELLGVVYGDGHIEKFPRTERLLIAANSTSASFIKRYAGLVQKIFNKEPKLLVAKKQLSTRITIYENLSANAWGFLREINQN